MAVAALLGREQELLEIEAFLDRMTRGPETMVVEGEPGIGKTTLWRKAIRLAEKRGIQTLFCRAAENEAKLSFSAFSDLLEPVYDAAVDALPGPQRRALDVALLRADPNGAPDARAVAAAFRSIVAGMSARSPVLIAIDDAHWLDRSSERAVEFALRRRRDDRVALLASRRPGGRPVLTTVVEDAERISLGPLSVGAIHELLKSRLGHSLPRPLLVRVHEAAAGNPFYALEIGREVLRAGVEPGDPLPAPQDLSQLVRSRIRRLRSDARDALLIAALAAEPTTPLISAVLGSRAQQALEPAEAAGIVETRQEVVRFAHPLFADAVQASATRVRRREVHRRLAESVEEAEERARHLALATEEPDATIAEALDEAANHAKARGVLDTAAELREHAVRLTPPDQVEKASERSLQRGIELRLAGDTDGARRVLTDLARRASSSLRARTLVELAAILYWSEGPAAAVECCEQALAAAQGDLAQEAKAIADLAVYCDFDLERSYRYARDALRLFEQLGGRADPNTHSQAVAIAAGRSLMLGLGLPRAELERAIEIESRAEARGEAVVGRIATVAGQWLKYVDDFDDARERLEDARRAAVEEGDESALPNILVHLAQTELWSGNWELASRYSEESCDIAEQLGQAYGGPPGWLALVDAHLGRADRARQTALEHLEAGELRPLAECFYRRALGFLDLSEGDVDAAARQLTRALELMERIRIHEPGVLRIHADAVEALVAAGELKDAERILAPWEDQGRQVELAWSLATSARCRALLQAAAGGDAAGSIENALVAHERLPMPFELGRTLLVKGQLERRAKQKAAARESLERAITIFDRLGAKLWAEKAQDELARVGLRRAPSDELTEGERRVAELAASGLTNREVAARLFMSPKTVEANLARAYRKLGIRSRAELGACLASVGSGTPHA